MWVLEGVTGREGRGEGGGGRGLGCVGVVWDREGGYKEGRGGEDAINGIRCLMVGRERYVTGQG